MVKLQLKNVEILDKQLKQVNKDMERQQITADSRTDLLYNKLINGEQKDLLVNEYDQVDLLGQFRARVFKKNTGDNIVLTPPYVTSFMSELIDVNKNDIVYENCSGTGGFMAATLEAELYIGIEYDELMYNYLLKTKELTRKSKPTILINGDGLKEHDEIRGKKPTKALINPPYKFEDKGMPFALQALNIMENGGLLAILIQDSAGNGSAKSTNEKILKEHTLLYSIKMPGDLFKPNAGVQTSIYVFEAGTPHDFDKNVVFVDLSTDGFKRTTRALKWDGTDKYNETLDKIKRQSGDDVILDKIVGTDDWNYTSHQVIDTTPTHADFFDTVATYLDWQTKSDRDENRDKLMNKLRFSGKVNENGETVSDIIQQHRKETLEMYEKFAENNL